MTRLASFGPVFTVVQARLLVKRVVYSRKHINKKLKDEKKIDARSQGPDDASGPGDGGEKW